MVMRYTGLLFITLAAVSLSTGCTNAQVKEGAGWAAGELLVLALDVALGSPGQDSADRTREDWEDNPANRWTPCLEPCGLRQELARDAERERRKESERRAEAAAFQAEFDEFMLALETAEQQSADPPLMATNTE